MVMAYCDLAYRVARVRTVLLNEAWEAWLTIGGIVIAFVGSAAFSCNPDVRGRIAGMVLQLLGVVLVGWEIENTRMRFGETALAERIKRWTRRVRAAFRAPTVISLRGTGRLGFSGGGSATLSATLSSKPVTVEQRLAALEAGVSDLRSEVRKNADEMRAADAALKRSIQAETEQRAAEGTALRELVKREATGGLDLGIVGLVWLAAGVILGALPGELGGLVGWVPCF
jgi:hypothetical protein